MNPTPVWIYLYFYVPLFLLLSFAVYFYYRALRHAGLEKLKKFTSIMLGSFASIVVLAFFRYDIFHFLQYIPFSFWGVIDNNYLRLTLVFGLTIYFIISTKVIWYEKNARYLRIAWLLIFVFNIASIVKCTYEYLTWKPRVINLSPNFPLVQNLMLDHYGPGIYAINMTIPFIWMAVSGISLLKIKKEDQRRSQPVQIPS